MSDPIHKHPAEVGIQIAPAIDDGDVLAHLLVVVNLTVPVATGAMGIRQIIADVAVHGGSGLRSGV